MIRDGVCPPGAARHPVARLTPGRGLAIAITLASVFASGAARTREALMRKTARASANRVASNLGLSACASEVLSRHGLLRAALVDPGGAALRLEAALASRPEGETGVTLALAELWYRARPQAAAPCPGLCGSSLAPAAAAAAHGPGRPGGRVLRPRRPCLQRRRGPARPNLAG